VLLGLLLGWVYVAGLTAALLATGSRWRRGAAVLVCATATPAAFFMPEEYPTFTAVLALGSLWFTARVIELVRERGQVPVFHRIWHTVGVVDALRAKRIARKLDLNALARLAVGLPIFFGGWAAVHYGSHVLMGAPRLIVRWGAGVVFMYVAVEVTVAVVIIAYGLLGIDPRPLHNDPILSKTITEFWNRRWNQAVHRFLKYNVFAPVARRGHAELGLALSFVASAYIHFAFMLPAVGLYWAGMMASFFLLQIPFVWVERALGVVRWRSALSRTWTLTLLLLSSPLFTEPVLQILDTWG
jgi:hypothetical protein